MAMQGVSSNPWEAPPQQSLSETALAARFLKILDQLRKIPDLAPLPLLQFASQQELLIRLSQLTPSQFSPLPEGLFWQRLGKQLHARTLPDGQLEVVLSLQKSGEALRFVLPELEGKEPLVTRVFR